jgi:hypothetical protein
LLDVDSPLRVFDKLSELPDLSRRLTFADAKIGKCVDVVPRFGSVACMATRAATGHIIDANYCQSPSGVAQTKVKASSGMVAIQLDTIYSPSLQVPYYRKDGTSTSPTLEDFGLGQLVLPVQMLKEHVRSESVRIYPLNADANESQNAGTTPPAPLNQPKSQKSAKSTTERIRTGTGITLPATSDSPKQRGHDSNSQMGNSNNDFNNEELSENETIDSDEDELTTDYLAEDGICDLTMNLTSDDIELLRASIVEGETTMFGRTPLRCEHLPDPPKPSEIRDIYSPLLGDVFHAMNRPRVPVKHEAKKGFFVALQNAFFIWNESQMDKLVSSMIESGVDENEIEKMKYYNSRLFVNCVEREVPPPSILFWRVRAVFTLYGPMKDSKTGKPLFNDDAWVKAKGVLREILLGYYSDPPGVSMYNKKLRKDGSVHKNKYGMDMVECIRGTNRTEAFHKNLIVTFRSWHTGIEMSDCLLAERRHRHNHRCSERRRFGFPNLGHYDTWLIDQLQILVLSNRRRILFPNWSNASEYKETDESFDIVAIHSAELHEALEHEWENRIDKSAVKLTSDLKYLSKKMGAPLPFLPFSTKEENMLFADCALRNDFPMSNPEAAAIKWCQYVDGVSIFPKLPAHIRIHKESFERNQRVKSCVERARSGQEKLDELNIALQPKSAANQMPTGCADALPVIQPNAMHNLPFVTTGGTAIGALPIPSTKRKRGARGKDKQPRAKKRCSRCVKHNGGHASECKGSGWIVLCEYFEEDGTMIAGI